MADDDEAPAPAGGPGPMVEDGAGQDRPNRG